MLGDSIVFGWGVDQDKTMSVILEERLAAADLGPVEVINSGVGNYNTAMEETYFRDRGISLSPDIVILNYFINDAESTPIYHDVPWYARRAYIYPVVGGAWDDVKRSLLGGPDWRDYYTSLYDDNAAGWRKAQTHIAALAEICRARGIRLIIANIPELHILRPYPFAEIDTRIAAIAAENHLEYLDLLPALQAVNPSTLWVTQPDVHPNARAHKLMADALAEYLLQHPSGAP